MDEKVSSITVLAPLCTPSGPSRPGIAQPCRRRTCRIHSHSCSVLDRTHQEWSSQKHTSFRLGIQNTVLCSKGQFDSSTCPSDKAPRPTTPQGMRDPLDTGPASPSLVSGSSIASGTALHTWRPSGRSRDCYRECRARSWSDSPNPVALAAAPAPWSPQEMARLPTRTAGCSGGGGTATARCYHYWSSR